MKTIIKLENLTSVDQPAEFLTGTQATAFSIRWVSAITASRAGRQEAVWAGL